MKEYIIEKDVRRLPFAIKIEKENMNFTNFGRAVERERSELRNASPKEQKSQVWKQKLSKKCKNDKLEKLKHYVFRSH